MAIKDILINSIKKAMQGEMDSVTLYQNAAAHSNDPDVKEFFLSRREEERQHYNYLLQYYQELSNDLQPTDLSNQLKASEGIHPIVSDDFLRRIGTDQYLFSAISTALLLEKDAIAHYRKCREETDNVTLQSFYQILENWEKVHYEDLLRIQKESETYYWQVNSFEPF